MEQPIPQVSNEDVRRIVLRDFPPDKIDAVLKMLNEYGSESWHRESARVLIAVLKIANGSITVLRQAVDTAKSDYRDVLAAAEYPGYMARSIGVLKLPASDQKAIVDSDWSQYSQWIHK